MLTTVEAADNCRGPLCAGIKGVLWVLPHSTEEQKGAQGSYVTDQREEGRV